MSGGGIKFEGFIFSLDDGPFDKSKVQAVSRDGQKTFERYMFRVTQEQVKYTIGLLLVDINSSTHLPESVYKNGSSEIFLSKFCSFARIEILT